MLDYLRLAHGFMALLVYHVYIFSRLVLLKRAALRDGTHGSLGYRDRFSEIQTVYTERMFTWFCRALDVRVTYPISIDPAELLGIPIGLLSNHVSTADIIAIYALLSRLGRTLSYWTLKMGLRRWPWGWAAAEVCGGFLNRLGDGTDRRTLDRFASDVARDRAVGVVFPEGTRTIEGDVTPQPGGAVKIWNAIKDEGGKILSVTLHYQTRDGQPPRFRTIQGIRGMIGCRLTIEARLVDAAEIDSAGGFVEWLNAEWAWKAKRRAVLQQLPEA